jgi:N-acetyl-anhydromuramyl-L-alanine amidase AmpD
MVMYPFIQAAFDGYGRRIAPALALVVHMAEGGGTVGYLSRDPKRGVSVHFVIEYSGRIVQMMRLDRISGSINPTTLRVNDDVPFVGYNGEIVRYGAVVRKMVLGKWDSNPNQAVITLEIEGYARRGPNIKQRVALRHLTIDVLDREPTIKGVLGHRDFQNVKACPGRFIPWANMAVTVGAGHHGLMR